MVSLTHATNTLTICQLTGPIISKALKFVLDNSKEQLQTQNQQQDQQDPSSAPAPVTEESDPIQEVTEESE